MGDSLEAAFVSFGSGLIFVSLIALFRKDVRLGFNEIFSAVSAKKIAKLRLGAGVLGASLWRCKPMLYQLPGLHYLQLHH